MGARGSAHRALLLAFSILVGLVACGPGQETGPGRLWVFARASADDLRIDVHLEGPGGQALDGARVWLSDPGGGVRLIDFDTRSLSYRYEGAAMDGEWRIQADSLAVGKMNLTVPVYTLAGSPEVISVQDGLGHRAEAYEELVASSPIRVEWRAVPGSETYLIELLVEGSVILTTQSSGGYYVVPENTVAASSDGALARLAQALVSEESLS